jgi:HK97 family phage prohead protease
MIEVEELAPRQRLEHRLASGGLLEVRFAERIIETVVMPYDVETSVLMPGGRWITESIAPGSFEGVERRANRIKVNRDHDIDRTVGRVVALHPSRAVGLVGELRIGRSALGDETLEYAADGILDASAGFAPFPGGETYTENRSRRRITKAYLGHVALVPEPAYDTANVLAVRHDRNELELEQRSTGPTPTPNLDQIRHWQLEAEFAKSRHPSTGPL